MKHKMITALIIVPILLSTSACNLPIAGRVTTPPSNMTFPIDVTVTTNLPIPVDVIVTTNPSKPGESTATPSLSPSPTLTPTPEKLTLGVATDTNCRTGPGSVYDRVGGIQVGETAEVFARDPGNQYFFIRNPDNASGSCWVWGRYATPSGSTAGLPVFTPPPTPTQPPTDTPTPTPVPTSLLISLPTEEMHLPASFKVTAVSASAARDSYNGTCPFLVTWSGTITANSAGTVNAIWELVGSSYTKSFTLVFASAGTKEAIPFSIYYSATNTIRARIHIIGPNEVYSNEFQISVTCIR